MTTTIEKKLATLQSDFAALCVRFGINPPPPPVIIEPDERKKLVAELAKLRADREVEARKQLAAIEKAKEDFDQALQHLYEASNRQVAPNQAYSASGQAFEKKQRIIVSQLRDSRSAVIDAFFQVVADQRKVLSEDIGRLQSMSRGAEESYRARLEGLAALAHAVDSWSETAESDEVLTARFQKELAKVPAFVNVKETQEPEPLSLTEQWHRNPYGMARQGKN